MDLLKLAFKNIRGSGFRSAAILLAVMSVAGFLLSTTMIIAGARNSLDTGLERLGADIIVVPEGAEVKIESALLMGRPVDAWMPRTNLEKIAAHPGVAAVSPQIYLMSMFDSPCCAVSEMFMVVYDPKTDFTVAPWLERNLGRELRPGEVIGGTYVFSPDDTGDIKLYGYTTKLVGNLDATGTGIDQTMFMTLETALEMSRSSVTTAMMPLSINPDVISVIMVKVKPDIDPHRVAIDIRQARSGMVPMESPDLFGMFRSQMNGLLWGFFIITLIVWAVTMVLIGIVFSLAANERRREMAVLRAVGATRGFLFRSVLAEAVTLAAAGSVTGITFSAGLLYILKDAIAGSLKMPFLFPSVPSFLGMFGGGVVFAIITVTLTALIPAVRIARRELAVAMRE